MIKNQIVIISKIPLECPENIFLNAKIELLQFIKSYKYLKSVCTDWWNVINFCSSTYYGYATVVSNYNPKSISFFRLTNNDSFILEITQQKIDRLSDIAVEINNFTIAMEGLSAVRKSNYHALMSSNYLHHADKSKGLQIAYQFSVKDLVEQLYKMASEEYNSFKHRVDMEKERLMTK